MTPLTLTDKQKTDYLANLWLVARADKELSNQEQALIAEIQKKITRVMTTASGAGKTE